MTNASKRVLITGIHGFTGRYMAAELEKHGYEVIGLGGKPSDDQNYHQINLNDSLGLRTLLAKVKPDLVLHLAALAFVGHGIADAFYQVNLIGTRNLLEAIELSGKTPDCVLIASSANVYGNVSGGILAETTMPMPANDYAVSKLAMEFMANLWKERLPIVITRPFNYTGVGQDNKFLLPKIVSHFKNKKKKIELGNLEVWRDFSDVRAVVSAYRNIVEIKPLGQVINISSGVTYSLRDVINMCQELTGHTIDIDINPDFIRPNEVKILCGDNSKLKSLTPDWEVIPLNDTLRWMLMVDQ